MMHCEFKHCPRPATQADCYINAWLCDDHAGFIWRMTDDYQSPTIDWDLLDSFIININWKGINR